MSRIAVAATTDLTPLRNIPTPVTLGEPATHVDDTGDQWAVFDDERLTPELAGRIAATLNGTTYREPPPFAGPPDEDDPWDRQVEANGGRNQVRAGPAAFELKPRPTPEET